MSSSDRNDLETLMPKLNSSASPLFAPEQNGANSEGARNWRESFPEIVGRSQSLQNVLQLVSKIARSDSAVLIHGESGTGKELIAASLHRLSSRASRRFVAINCGAIPEALLESELFGHERGAFTGAHQRHVGRFEQAAGGTLFLDEIGDMPQRLQVKLLRVLQEKQFTRVGGSDAQNADVRIVAATNLDLNKAVQEGRFRLDLFYRLNVLPIELPPLRERRDDIGDLLHHFLKNTNRVHELERECFFSNDVLNLLVSYDWPGNVRELQNLVERLVVMANGGEIKLEHLPNDYLGRVGATPQGYPGASSITSFPEHSARPVASTSSSTIIYPQDYGELPTHGLNLAEFIEGLENNLILQALERTQNNKQQAAKLLGLNRTTLVERIKKRGLHKIVDLNESA